VLDGNEQNPRIKLFETFAASVAALQAGDVDTVLTDSAGGNALVAQSGGKLKMVGRRSSPNSSASSFPKGSDLVAPINAGIAALEADKTFDAITQNGSSTTSPDDVTSYSFEGYGPAPSVRWWLLHGVYYARHWNFGLPFEAKVASELSEFLTRMDPARDLFLTAWTNDRLDGSITIDVSPAAANWARICAGSSSPTRRAASGLGKVLMRRAVAHCDALGVTEAAG
jgi:hypothetical protein